MAVWGKVAAGICDTYISVIKKRQTTNDLTVNRTNRKQANNKLVAQSQSSRKRKLHVRLRQITTEKANKQTTSGVGHDCHENESNTFAWLHCNTLHYAQYMVRYVNQHSDLPYYTEFALRALTPALAASSHRPGPRAADPPHGGPAPSKPDRPTGPPPR